MLPRRATIIRNTFATGSLAAISETHAQACAFDALGNGPEADALALRMARAAYVVTGANGDGTYRLLQEGTGVEIDAPGEELTAIDDCEDDEAA